MPLGMFAGASENITQIIIYINAVIFLLSLIFSFSSMTLSADPFRFLSPSDKGLLFWGATGTIPISVYGHWWTLISASYLHGGLMHIFFNMLALYQLGHFVAHEFGVNRFVIIYTFTGIVGFFLSYLAGIPLTIGASANICGFIGAILYYGKTRGGFYGNAIYKQAMGWVVGLVIFGILIPGINNWAHGGGILSGILLAHLLGYNEQRGEAIFHRTLSTGCIILTIGVLFWMIIRAIYVFLLS